MKQQLLFYQFENSGAHSEFFLLVLSIQVSYGYEPVPTSELQGCLSSFLLFMKPEPL